MSLIDLSAAPSLQPQYAERPRVVARGALVNVGARADVLNGRPLTRYASADSSLKIAPAANGLAIINGYPSQSYSVPLEAIGTQAVTIIALIGGAEQSSRSPYYAYPVGVFNGTSGIGITSGHMSISGNWGMYQDGATSLISAAETWPTAGLHLVAYTRTPGGERTLYRNGVVKGTNSNANQSVPAAPLRIGSMYDAGANPFGSEVPVYYAGVFIGEAWSAEQVRDLAVNPWAIFAHDDQLISFPSAGGGTAALGGTGASASTGSLSVSLSAGVSGQSATTTTGSLTPSIATFSAALTGSAATTATGAAAPAISKALTGSAATTSTGAASAAISKALTGSATTTATGAAAPEISKALTGSAATTATGAATPEISKALTGSATTTATGAATPEISKALTGSATTTATGSLTPDGAIAGTGVTTATGSLSPALSKAIEGQAATTSAGTLSVTLSSALAGVASVTSAGSLTAQTADTVLSGQQTTTATGALAASITITLSGVGSTADVGTLTVVQNPVSGVEAATTVGLLTPSLTLGLSGRQVTSSAGYLDSGAPTFRELVHLKSGIRTSVTLSSPLSG